MWADVTFLGFLPSSYTYSVPETMARRVGEGVLVVAPLRRRRLAGIISKTFRELPPGRKKDNVFKPILHVPFQTPVFPSDLLTFYRWCADYYRIPLGGILKTALPLPRKALKGERITVTKEGIVALRYLTDGGDTRARNFLRHLDEGRPPLPMVAQREMWEAFLEWTERGWIRWEYPGFSGSFHPTVLVYHPMQPEKEPSRMGPREREIRAYVKRQGAATHQELIRVFPKSQEPLRRLVGKGVLRAESLPVTLTEGSPKSLDPAQPPVLTHEQALVFSVIREEIGSSTPRPVLVHGVTGSGKTELYIRAIQAVIEGGKSSLILVPEIVLTPQLVSRIRSRCGIPIVTWHSHLTEKERWRQWLLLHERAPVVVIGARSAIFTPVKNLGLIVVDEEHDPSFKQEEGLLYNARDVAVVRSRFLSCPLILGSATPSVESFHNVKKGKFRYCSITRRPTGQPLPVAEVVDLRREGVSAFQETRGLMLSRPLREALIETYRSGQQALLFLNRRGYARVVICSRCGEAVSCPHCSVTLILHKPLNLLKCHYCGFSRKLPEKCEVCGGVLMQMGGGTQRLEEEIRGILPEAQVARLDRDTMQKRVSYEELLERLRRREIDILIGTQMIVKGHDYPGIVLMGIVMADHSLKFPDFRASERTFQLLTQASGRCGRGDLPGRVIIQTLSPVHYSIRYAIHHDYIGFYEEEISTRRELGYPPFTRLTIIRVSGPDPKGVENKAARLASVGQQISSRLGARIQVLGPTPALLSRLRGRTRWQIILKGKNSGALHQLVNHIFRSKAAKREKGMKVQVEFDPVQMV